MNFLPDGITSDDLHQWLSGGVCVVLRNGEWVPGIYEGVDRTNADGLPLSALIAVGPTFGDSISAPLDEVAGHWPMIGSTNLENHRFAIYVQRKVAKQFKRTYHGRLCSVTIPRMWEVRKLHGEGAVRLLSPSSVEVIQAIFKQKYPSVTQAFDMLDNGWLSVALDPRVIVAADQNGKRMVYYRGELAATTTGGMLDPVADLLTCRLINKALAGRFRWTVDLQAS